MHSLTTDLCLETTEAALDLGPLTVREVGGVDTARAVGVGAADGGEAAAGAALGLVHPRQRGAGRVRAGHPTHKHTHTEISTGKALQLIYSYYML